MTIYGCERKYLKSRGSEEKYTTNDYYLHVFVGVSD